MFMENTMFSVLRVLYSQERIQKYIVRRKRNGPCASSPCRVGVAVGARSPQSPTSPPFPRVLSLSATTAAALRQVPRASSGPSPATSTDKVCPPLLFPAFFAKPSTTSLT